MSNELSNVADAPAVGFKISDLVRLKSGGPDMTVTHVSTMDHGAFCVVSWFDDSGKRDTYQFPAECLTLVPTNAS